MTSRNTAKKHRTANNAQYADLAVLGPPNTFTDLAAKKYERQQKKQLSKIYCTTIAGVFKAVEKGKAKKGIVPFKNNLRGPVAETTRALSKGGFVILKKWNRAIRHSLVALSGVRGKEIRTISSHPQALKQCGNYLKKKYPLAQKISTNSTMAALAKMVKRNDRKMAAIIPAETGRKSGMRILAKNIADSKKNRTVFILISGS